MRTFVRIVLLTLTVCGIASAQPVGYSIVATTCPMMDIPTNCTVNMSPANNVGFYPSMTLADDLSNNAFDNAPPGDTYRLIEFETTQGPSGGDLGNGIVQVNAAIPYGEAGHYRSYPVFAQYCNTSDTVCITDVTALTVYFEGNYAPASGGGAYNGYLTMHFSYQYKYFGPKYGGWKWVRSVTGGSVSIN